MTPVSAALAGVTERVAAQTIAGEAVDLAEIETLVACAANGSMASAAQLLGISRPAVAKRIRNLENLAGRPLLHRSGRGVALTDAGASLLVSARGLLDERETVVEALRRISSEGPSERSGMHRLLGDPSTHARAAQQPEARLAEAEQLLEAVLSASRTAIAVSDLETGSLLAFNDAFCSFTGRGRAELLSRPPAETGVWESPQEHARLCERLLRDGVAERLVMHARLPEGGVRAGRVTARLVALGGARRVLWAIDDVFHERPLAASVQGDGSSTPAAIAASGQRTA